MATCTDCLAGKMSLAQQSVCSDCATGMYQCGSGATFCVECAQGYISASTGSTKCTICSAGKFSSSDSLATACTPCVVGKYAASDGKTVCAECSWGQWQDAPAKSDCKDCVVGKYAGEGSGSCVECSPGKYATARSAFCTDCAPGKYSTIAQTESCKTCDKSFMCPKGSDAQFPCSPGNWTRNYFGASVCDMCAPGTYKTMSSTVGAVETADGGGFSGKNSAIFTIYNTNTGNYTFDVTTAGSGYDSTKATGDGVADHIFVKGSDLGGVDGVNDCTLTVTGAAGAAGLSSSNVAVTGTSIAFPKFSGIQGCVAGTVETSGAGGNSAIFTIHNDGSGAYTFDVTAVGSNYDSSTGGGRRSLSKDLILAAWTELTTAPSLYRVPSTSVGSTAHMPR